MRAFAASFLIVFSVLSEVAFVAFRGLPAPVVTVLLVLGATLGICLAVSSAARNVSPAAFAASSIALAVFAARWLSLTSLAVSLISFAVSLVAAASCTASASSVIAPLSRNYFTVSLAVEDTSRIVLATLRPSPCPLLVQVLFPLILYVHGHVLGLKSSIYVII
jgi:hypothetical protein